MADLPGKQTDSPMSMPRPETRPYSPEREEACKADFPYLSMAPEEYAARHSHSILCFSLHRYEYKDQRLKLWLQSLFDLLTDRKRIAILRQTYLTPEEIEEAERVERMEDQFWI